MITALLCILGFCLPVLPGAAIFLFRLCTMRATTERPLGQAPLPGPMSLGVYR